MSSSLREALDGRDPEAIIDALDDDPHLDPAEGLDAVAAWEWIEPTEHAPRFARTLLRALDASAHALRMPAGWVAQTGLGLAERALEDVDDADGSTFVYGALLTQDVMNDEALDAWIEQAADGDGYFDPESLGKAHGERHQPGAPKARLQLLRAVEALAGFSWNVTNVPRAKALEYLARALRSERAPISAEALALATERLVSRGSFQLPSAEELASAIG
ncbi:hypothetical protein [Paraliomyxa miuraensis]|uniref:hypothetical protein n=1 Tax=Paraliomyxa miuraensis TaxID=376150 RepID=UPI00224EE542|nr:hypothetical protein [Paraliomyxa miuraensis]MCX4246669.1 hypothetical protein [Paraliomyxa miuraensis]